MNETQSGRPQRPKLKIAIKEDKNESKSERIPFTKSTYNNKCQESEKPKIVKNKENKEMTKSAANSRPKTRQDTESKDKDQVVNEVETVNRPVTPPPENDEPTAPLTPTANLKMLFSAVSPEIRNRDKKNDRQNETKADEEENSTDSLEIDIDLPSSQEAEWKPGSRKEKSLGLLCQKFLQKYPEYPEPSYHGFICLDEVAKELNVERRRIYDIVNVLESVEIVSRMAKNKYAWHGKTNIVYTLAKLKALGEAEGYAEQMRQLRDYELNRELEEQNGCVTTTKPPFHNLDESESNKEGYFAKAAMRKDRSLGIMSQKFLMLFLVSQPKTVNLDLSAKILIGDANIDRTENGKFKTKIRRLYDIANILTSLDLIRKVHVTEIRGRKPAFRYIGPDVDNMKDINVCYNDGYHRPSSRHSLLDCVKNHNVADLVSTYKSKPSTQGSEFPNTSKGFSRHSSFEQICQVAENEIIKMMSLPSSPTESSAPIDDFPRSLSQEELGSAKNKSKKVPPKGKHIILQHSDGQFHVVDNDANGNNPGVTASHKLPVTTIINKSTKAMPKPIPNLLPKESTPSTVVIKTKLPSAVLSKQQTMIPLTKEQIDAVLKSLKVPVPVSKNAEKESGNEVESQTQDKESTEKLDQSQEKEKSSTVTMTNVPTSSENSDQKQGLKRTLSEDSSDQESKKIKIYFPSPPSDEDDVNMSKDEKMILGINKRKKISEQEKPSPQRALQFTPDVSSQSHLSELAKINQSIPKLVNTDSEMELAIPLNEDSNSSSSQFQTQTVISNSNTVTNSQVAVQVPVTSPPTILQFPVMKVPQQMATTTTFNPQPPQQVIKSFNNQTMQIIPVTATGLQGQSINFMVPVTYSPPITPNNPSSPSVFTFPTSQPNVSHSSIHHVIHQPAPMKLSSNSLLVDNNNVVIKIATPRDKVTTTVPPQMMTPTERPNIPSSKFFGHTPGGFVPVSSSVAASSLLTKDIVQTARKLDLPDIISA